MPSPTDIPQSGRAGHDLAPTVAGASFGEVEVIETWWNGRHGTEPGDELRRDARLLRDGEWWHVEARVGGPDGDEWRSDPGNELYARRLLAQGTRDDGWRRVG